MAWSDGRIPCKHHGCAEKSCLGEMVFQACCQRKVELKSERRPKRKKTDFKKKDRREHNKERPTWLKPPENPTPKPTAGLRLGRGHVYRRPGLPCAGGGQRRRRADRSRSWRVASRRTPLLFVPFQRCMLPRDVRTSTFCQLSWDFRIKPRKVENL